MKWIFVAILAACVAPAARAQNTAITNFCTSGATNAVTQGSPSSNTLQGVYPYCTVTVYNTGTTTLATLYSNATGTVLANPFLASQTGQFTFYSTPVSCVDITLSGGIPATFPIPITLPDVCTSASSAGVITPAGTNTIQASNSTGTALQVATSQLLSPLASGLLHFNSTAQFGDSTINGEGVATATEVFGAELMRDVPGPWQNFGVSGALMNQIARNSWSGWSQQDTYFTTLIGYQGGINDANSGVLDNTGGLNNGINSLIAGVAHIAIPLANQQLSSTATPTGTWTSAATNFPVNAVMTGNWQQSTVNNSTTLYILPAGAHVFYWWGLVDGNLGTFTVTLNGVPQVNRCTGTTTWIAYGCNGQTIISGAGIAMGGASLTGSATLPNNTLTVTVTSATGAGNVVYDGGAATVPAQLGNNVVAVQGLQKQAGDAMSTATADFNNAIGTGYGILSAALPNIFFVDVRGGVPPGIGYPGARAANTTTDYAVTVQCPGPTNGAGTTPLHMTGCGIQTMVALYENAAAAAGYPIAIHNIGTGSYFPGPVISAGLGFPGQADYRDDWKIGTSGRYNNAARMPGLILNAGSNGYNINTDAGARAAFEHVFDLGVNGDAFKLLTDNPNRPITMCVAVAGQPIANDVCPYAFYPGGAANVGGAYYRGTTHLGASGNFNSANVGVGTNLALAYDSQQAITGANHATALVVYLKTGTTAVTLPQCLGSIGQNAANWVEFIHKDSTDTGTIQFLAVAGDTVNGGASVSYTNVPNFTTWTVQCSQNTATSGNVSITEAIPGSAAQLTGTTATITGTALTNACITGTATVTGAVVGHPVQVSTTDGTDIGANFSLRASVTTANTVTVSICNPTAVSATPPSKAYNVVTY